MWRPLVMVLVCSAAACGDDGGGGGGGGSGSSTDDASNGVPADAAIDGSGAGQGAGQYCETLQQGGPYCQSDLTCCGDKICRLSTDCPGMMGYIACTQLADCPNGNVCCQTTLQTFCTKKSACTSYGGVELP